MDKLRATGQQLPGVRRSYQNENRASGHMYGCGVLGKCQGGMY